MRRLSASHHLRLVRVAEERVHWCAIDIVARKCTWMHLAGKSRNAVGSLLKFCQRPIADRLPNADYHAFYLPSRVFTCNADFMLPPEEALDEKPRCVVRSRNPWVDKTTVQSNRLMDIAFESEPIDKSGQLSFLDVLMFCPNQTNIKLGDTSNLLGLVINVQFDRESSKTVVTAKVRAVASALGLVPTHVSGVLLMMRYIWRQLLGDRAVAWT